MAEQLTRLRNEDFSDRELLHRFYDIMDSEGWATAQQVADALNITHEHPVACVTGRLTWLQRYGAMERVGDRWRMTEEGQALAFGEINSVMEAALHSLPNDKVLALTRAVTRRYRQAGPVAAVLMRREWRHGEANRPADGDTTV